MTTTDARKERNNIQVYMLHRSRPRDVGGPYWPTVPGQVWGPGPITACGLFIVAPEWHSPRPGNDAWARARPLLPGHYHVSSLDSASVRGPACPECFFPGETMTHLLPAHVLGVKP